MERINRWADVGCFTFLLLTSLTVFSYPVKGHGGIDLVDLTAQDAIQSIRQAGPVVFWLTDDWALVQAGSVSKGLPLVDPAEGVFLYLAVALNDDPGGGLKNLGEVVEIEPRVRLVASPQRMGTGWHGTWKILEMDTPFDLPESWTIEIPAVEYNEIVQDLINHVSETSLMTDLTILVDFVTRYSYAPQCLEAATWLGQEYSDLGLDVSTQDHTSGMAPNVIAELPGQVNPEQIVIVCGHYDSITAHPLERAPGADDNGTGSVLTLQAARIMAGFGFEKTIRFIAFSGEEQGLHGSTAYATKMLNEGQQIVGVLNFDMVGWVSNEPEDLDCIGNNNSTDLTDFVIDCAQVYQTVPTRRLINGSLTYSDHAPFWNRGFQAICGIEDEPIDYPYYHKVGDTVDKVNPAFLTEVTRTAVAAAAQLAVPMPEQVYVVKHELSDNSGDSDGYLDPGETLDVGIFIKNNLSSASGPLEAVLSCSEGSEHIEVLNGSCSFDDIPPGSTVSNESQPFRFQVKPGFEEFTVVEFTVRIECSEPHMQEYRFACEATSYSFQPSIHEWNMDTNPNWNVTGTLWQWGRPQGGGGTDHGYPDPSSGYTGSNVIGTVLAGDYPANSQSVIQSDPFDCSNVFKTELHFRRWLNVEQPRYDEAAVWVDDGTGFRKAWSNSIEITDSNWQDISIDISQMADGKPAVRIQFSIESDQGWEYSGWNIDDIRIAGFAPGDSLPTPTPSPGGTPTPTPVPQDIGVKLLLNQDIFESGDPFLLTIDYWNTSPQYRALVLFIILDIDGQYWFWPGWTSGMNYRASDLEPGTVVFQEVILDFTWPKQTGRLDGLRFWAAFTDIEFSSLAGNYDFVEWSYR